MVYVQGDEASDEDLAMCWRPRHLCWMQVGIQSQNHDNNRNGNQIDNYNDNDLHNILSGTSSRAKDAPPAQGLFWFVASI